jgi:hypothetical protein
VVVVIGERRVNLRQAQVRVGFLLDLLRGISQSFLDRNDMFDFDSRAHQFGIAVFSDFQVFKGYLGHDCCRLYVELGI